MKDYFEVLERSILSTLETYSNVHRGSGQFSAVTTMLYEEARNVILDYLHLEKDRFAVVFCSPLRACDLVKRLSPGSYHILSNEQTGINTGVLAIAAEKRKLAKAEPVQAGGGTTRLVSRERIAWAEIPDRYEAGTPAIINVIALARALQLIMKHGEGLFLNSEQNQLTAKQIMHSDAFDELSGEMLFRELKSSVIGRHIQIPVLAGTSEYVNLDYAASTPALYPVWECYRRALRQSGKTDRELISEARKIISGILNAPEEQYDIIFASNATEGINIVAAGLCSKQDEVDESAIMLTLLEHNSNDLPWRMNGFRSIVRLNVDEEGFIDPAELESTLSDYNEQGKYGNMKITLMSVTGSSNVLGTCNDLESISRIVHRFGTLLLVDAAQLIAHRKTDVEKCGIDFLVFSGHKAYAPFGTGVLISRKGMLHYTDERWNEIRSSGEQNIAGITALGKSLSLLEAAGIELIRNEELTLTKKALKAISDTGVAKIYGINDAESLRIQQRGAVISFSLKKILPDKVAGALANEGIGIRYGCHCAHLLVKNLLHVGPLLEKFQFVLAGLFPGLKFPGVARISFGIGTIEEDIEKFTGVLKKIILQQQTGSNINFMKEIDDFKISVRNKVFGPAEAEK